MLVTKSLEHPGAGCALDPVTGHATAPCPLKPVTLETIVVNCVVGQGKDTTSLFTFIVV